jgi:hypothetical protein
VPARGIEKLTKQKVERVLLADFGGKVYAGSSFFKESKKSNGFRSKPSKRSFRSRRARR